MDFLVVTEHPSHTKEELDKDLLEKFNTGLKLLFSDCEQMQQGEGVC